MTLPVSFSPKSFRSVLTSLRRYESATIGEIKRGVAKPPAIFRKMIRELGLRPEPFHALRHTHATELLRAGYQPYQVASRLGDEVASVLNTYAHAKPEDDRELAVAFESLIKSA